MNTTVNELKELYESLGGTPSDVAGITTIPDMIAALAEVAGTTIELPAVTAADNGKVLIVGGGKWTKGEVYLPAFKAYTAAWASVVGDGGYAVPNSKTPAGALVNSLSAYDMSIGFKFTGTSIPVKETIIPISYTDGDDIGHGSIVANGYTISVTADPSTGFTVAAVAV